MLFFISFLKIIAKSQINISLSNHVFTCITIRKIEELKYYGVQD